MEHVPGGVDVTGLNLPAFRAANASFVTPQLVVGGDLNPEDDVAVRQLAELVEAGVTHIVDVRIEWSDRDYVAALQPLLGYLHHGVDDAGQTIPGEWFDVGVDFALASLANPGAIVFAHCHMGINRGPSLGFAVLLAQGWDPIDAIETIRRARPIAFVAYAEDALAWHHERTRATRQQQLEEQLQLAAWRRANNLDVADVIRKIRLSS